MAKTNLHFDVILTEDACKVFKDEAVSLLLNNGKYFYCTEVDPNGSYFYMKVENKIGDEIFYTDVYMPHHFILYYVSDDARKRLGF